METRMTNNSTSHAKILEWLPEEAAKNSLTRAITQVFRDILDIELTTFSEENSLPDKNNQLIGSVGFTGDIQGLICLFLSYTSAQKLTSNMFDLEFDEVTHDLINDAVGEITNIIAGSVTQQLPHKISHQTVLTIPSITRGEDLKIDSISIAYLSQAHFLFEESPLSIKMYIKTPTQ